MSTIYGVDKVALAKIRQGEHGMLSLEKRNQRYVPQDINKITAVNTEKINDDITLKIKDAKPIKSKDDKLVKALQNNGTKIENMIETTIPNSEMITNITNNLLSEDVCIQNRDNETTCYQFGK